MAVDEDEVLRKQESTKSTRSGQDQVGKGRAGEVSGRAPLETGAGPGLGDTSLTGNGSEGRGDQGSSRETAKKKRRGVLASAFDHADDEDPFQVMDAELDDGQGCPTGKGRTIDEDLREAEREWMAMQSRQRMVGDNADLHGGIHVIDVDEFVTTGARRDEANGGDGTEEVAEAVARGNGGRKIGSRRRCGSVTATDSNATEWDDRYGRWGVEVECESLVEGRRIGSRRRRGWVTPTDSNATDGGEYGGVEAEVNDRRGWRGSL